MSTSPYSGKTYGKGTATKTSSTPSSSTTNQSSTAPTSPQQVSMAAFQKANPGVSVSASNFDPTTGAYKGTSTITPKDVTTTPPVLPTTPPPAPLDINSILGNANTKITGADVANMGATTIDKNQSDITKLYQDLFATQKSPESIASEALQQSGKLEAQKKLNEETAKLTAIISQGQALQQQVVGQGRGIPETIIGGQQAQIARETAIQSLPIQASIEAAKGNLDAANEYFNILFKAKTDDANNKLQYGLKLIDVTSQFATDKQKLQLELVKDKLKAQNDKEQSNINFANDLLKTASQYGLTSDASSRVAKIDMSSPDAISQVSSILSPFLSKSNREIVKVGDNAYMFDKVTGKIIGNAIGAGTNTTTTLNIQKDFLPIIKQAAALGESVNAQKTIKDDMTYYLKNNDYESAYKQIENTVENQLKGTTKTRFADARIDVNVMSGLRNKIQDYQDAGGDMGLLKGTAEQIERRLGVVKNPAYATLAVALQREFQAYRNNMTGAAFSPKESREYDSVNPSSKKTLDLNLSVIDGAISQLDNRITSTVDAKITGASDLRNLANKTNSSKNNVFMQAEKQSNGSIFNSVTGWVLPKQ